MLRTKLKSKSRRKSRLNARTVEIGIHVFGEGRFFHHLAQQHVQSLNNTRAITRARHTRVVRPLVSKTRRYASPIRTPRDRFRWSHGRTRDEPGDVSIRHCRFRPGRVICERFGMDVRVYSSGERRVLRRFTARIVISRASTCRPSVHFGAGTVEGDAIPGSRTHAPLFFPSRAHKRTLPGVF